MNKKFLKIIHKCLSATLAVFCIVVDNRGMGDVSFSGSLFATISTYMDAENCWCNYNDPFDPKYACEEATKNTSV